MTLVDGKHFKVSEFRCRDGTPYPEGFVERWETLRDLCDAIREMWGGPLIVVSGYRSIAHNNDLIERDKQKGAHGVASGSQHVQGRAADLKTRIGYADVPQLWRVIDIAYQDGKLPTLGGLGMYPVSGWVHVDTHRSDDGHLRRWTGT